jgi:hypothetical protein
MHHGLDNDCDTCTFQSDFGTGDTTQADVTRYIVGRASVFFQNIIGGYAQLRQDTTTTHKVFVECPNYRIKCNLSNNDPGCHANDNCGNIDDKHLKIKRH